MNLRDYYIELTLFTSGKHVLVNFLHVGDITPTDRGGCKITYWRSEVDDYDLWVAESYDVIKKLVMHIPATIPIIQEPRKEE